MTEIREGQPPLTTRGLEPNLPELTESARTALRRIRQQLPQILEQMPQNTPEKAWAIIQFLREVATTSEIRNYLRATVPRNKPIGDIPGERLIDTRIKITRLGWPTRAVNPYSLKPAHLFLNADGLLLYSLLKGPHYLPLPDNFESFQTEWWENNHDRPAVKSIANIDLNKALGKIQQAIE